MSKEQECEPISEERLEEMLRRTRGAGLEDLAAAVEELRFLRGLFREVYHLIPDVPGTEELQARIERYAGRLGVILPAKSDVH
jgi:hypothetical protein